MTDSPEPRRGIRAVPQTYSGVRFASTLEADWACTFDFHGITWSYEPEAVELSDGQFYRCDFWLPGQLAWVEVKGPHEERIDKPWQLLRDLGCDPDDWKSPIVLICRWPERGGGPVERADGEPIGFGLCGRCSNYTFVDLDGAWQCRTCGARDEVRHLARDFSSPLAGLLAGDRPRNYATSLQFQRVERKRKGDAA